MDKAQAITALKELSDKYWVLTQDEYVVEVDPAPLDSICEQHEKLFEQHFPNRPYFGIDSESE